MFIIEGMGLSYVAVPILNSNISIHWTRNTPFRRFPVDPQDQRNITLWSCLCERLSYDLTHSHIHTHTMPS
jgi:hypothetical protein